MPQAADHPGRRAGSIVYVVDATNKAAPRPVEVVYAAGEDAVVSGVQAGERVVSTGRQNLRPGARRGRAAPPTLRARRPARRRRRCRDAVERAQAADASQRRRAGTP